MEDEVKNVLVTIINIVMNSEDAEAIVRASWAILQQNLTEINQLRLLNGTVEG
jgi:hypothetical protein